MARKITVKQITDQPEIPTEVIADAIVAISQGMKKLLAGRLNETALVLLIQRAAPGKKSKFGSTPVSAKEVKAVLEGIESLEKVFLKKKPSP